MTREEQDILREDFLRDQDREYSMRNDWDYLMDDIRLKPTSSIKELSHAKKIANKFGWDISYEELIEEVYNATN